MSDKGFRFQKTDHLKEDILKSLEEGLLPLFESNRYKEYLRTTSKFYDYSVNNTILIMLQKPDASYVAGFQKWKEIGRFVNKGEVGLKVIACGEKKETTVDTKGNEKGDVRRFFFPVTVFDISQTSGKDLVLNPFESHELDGSIDKFETLRDALIKTANCPVYFEKMQETSAKGYYSIKKNEIHISDNLSQPETISVLVHELAHSKIHRNTDALIARGTTSRTREVEAESVAFVICNRLGIDTSATSFEYIAGWSKNKDLPELKNSLQIITDAAKSVSDEVLSHLNTKSQTKERTKTPCR